MTAFASAEDLASFLQLPTVDRYSAELVLDLASDAVRDEAGQDVDVGTSDEVYDGLPADHPSAHVIFLRRVPVRSVTEVTSDGVALDPADYGWSASGRLVRLAGVFSAARRGVTVAYAHGWDVDTREHRIARLVTIQVAARAYANPHQVDTLTVGSITRTFPRKTDGRTGLVELTRAERRMLDPLRR